jgi:hypothetical protein
MQRVFFLLWIWAVSVYAHSTDFDEVVVGTSPISMFEAIYRTCLGHRILVVEQAAECGGAWKSIEICGIPHADMGCHEFGTDARVQKFLEEYAGCKIIKSTNSLYPSQGCYEFTHNLELLLRKLGAELWLNSKLESVYIDDIRHIAEIKINGTYYTTAKIIVTAGSEINFANIEKKLAIDSSHSMKYPHIYVLVSDPTPPRFTYKYLNVKGVSRAMNLTPFVGLKETGSQLIVFQVYGDQYLDKGEEFLNELKKMGLVDPNAQLLREESYVYEQTLFDHNLLNEVGDTAIKIFEIINASHITQIGTYIDKWKTVMKPWKEVMDN